MPFLGLMTKREFQKALEAIKAGVYPEWLLATADAQRFNIPDASIYGAQADLYRKLSWVLAAVDMIAQAAALTPFEVARVVSGKEPRDIPNHEFEMLLINPNPLDSRYEFLHSTIAFWKLNGNAYWYMNRENEFAPPDELWVIPPYMVRPVPDGQSFIRGYLYSPGNGRDILLEPWKVLHFRRFHPFNRFVGMSAIESLAMVSRGDLSMQEWNTRLFAENNARLPGILTFASMIADPIWKKIKEDTDEASKKRQLLMLRGVGEGGVDWKQSAANQKEMEFLKGRQANKEEIWAVLAPGLSSMMDVNATEANARTGRATFNEYAVYPMHVMMAEKITNYILPAYGGRKLIGRFEDIRVTDRQLELEEQKTYAETHTVEEIRERFYSDEPLGDERDKLIPSQLRADSGGVQDVENPPNLPGVYNPQQALPKPRSPGDEPAALQPPEEPVAEYAIMSSAMEDLHKWRKKALKRLGKAVRFESTEIPRNVMRYVEQRLPGYVTAKSVNGLFDDAMKLMAQQPTPTEAVAVLRGLQIALKNGNKPK